MQIVYVDDDADDREMFSDAVREIDPQISCIVFDSGQSVLDYLGTTGTFPNYIFIDINMPRMNGYECAKAIKSKKKLKNIQIIMYSTSFNPHELAEFTQLGIKFLDKPNKFINLVHSIRCIIL